MKNLLFVFLLATSIAAVGQNDKRKMTFDQEFTAEQQAILKTKKMTLALDLDQNQQNQLLALHQKWIQEKANTKASYQSMSMKELSADQKFELMRTKLDKKIDQQKELKKVLDKDQYELWKESTMKKHDRSKAKKMQGHKKDHKNQKN